jgi:hypothetical protein
VDLVNEQQRAVAGAAAGSGFLEHAFEVDDAGEHDGDLQEMQAGARGLRRSASG